jgi:transitional endoplasmic reticulum ATPase
MNLNETTARTQAQLTVAALKELAVIGGQKTKDDDIKFEGRSFVFPEQYRGNLRGLLADVERYVEGQEQPVTIDRMYDYDWRDGANAVHHVLKTYFGYSLSLPTQSFFGSTPPKEKTIDIGYVGGVLQKVTVPWGKLLLPGLDGAQLSTNIAINDQGNPCFQLMATCRRADKSIVDGFFEVVGRYLDSNSIYRGHAVYGDMGYIDTDRIDPDQFVYTQDVWAQAETNILSPLRDTDVLRRQGMSLKRVVLLEGPFGSGKSGLGRSSAKVAVANGKTAIIARPGVDDPFQVLATGAQYQPSFIFVEDVDTFAANMDPNYVTRLLDAFDGFKTKDVEMTLVLTTNHVDRIHKGMLRPGRLDAVIHIGEMDRPGVEQLCRIVIGNNLEPDVDFDKVYEATKGFMPAFVREAFERAVRYTIARTGDVGAINTDDLIHTCNSLRAQLALQEGAKDSHAEVPAVDAAMRDLLVKSITEHLDLNSIVDNVVESRVDGAALYNEDGDRKLTIRTN